MSSGKPTNWCWCGERHAEDFMDAQDRLHHRASELCLYPGCGYVRRVGDYCDRHAAYAKKLGDKN